MGFTVAAQDRCARRARAPDTLTLGSAGLRLNRVFKFFRCLRSVSKLNRPLIYLFLLLQDSALEFAAVFLSQRVLGRSTSVSWRGLPDCKRRCISHQVQFCNAVSCLHRFAKLEASNTPLSVAAAAAVVVGRQLQHRRDQRGQCSQRCDHRRRDQRSWSKPKSRRRQRRPSLARPPSNSPSAAPSVRSAPWIEW